MRMRKNRKSKKVIAAVCVGLAVILAAGVFVLHRRRAGGTAGVTLTAVSAIETGEFPCYQQGDPEWGGDKLGDSRFSMKGSGCLTSCIAAALSGQARAEGQEEKVLTPGELNRLFSENSVYNQEGNIVWGKIAKALPDTEVIVASGVDNDEINGLLEEGKYPIVKVKNHGNGAWHWVVLAGADERGFLCMDPLKKEGALVPLSDHGDVAYSMRTVYWQ